MKNCLAPCFGVCLLVMVLMTEGFAVSPADPASSTSPPAELPMPAKSDGASPVPAASMLINLPVPRPGTPGEQNIPGKAASPSAPGEKEACVSLEVQAFAAWERKDYETSRRLWEVLAAAGYGGAMNNLGLLWDNGQGVAANAATAAVWFKRAATAGHPAGMNNYARMLELGRGLPRDTAAALKWYRLAADSGLAEAQFNLGVFYERGMGVEKNSALAVRWYERAAGLQQVEAQSRLALLYAGGTEVKKDPARATALAYRAALAGDPQAAALLSSLAREAPARHKADLFGLSLASATRPAMRQALAQAGVSPLMEDAGGQCDIYETDNVIAGSRTMLVCYDRSASRRFGFLSLEYAAENAETAGDILSMIGERYGAPSSGAGTESRLWNLGNVVISAQAVPENGFLSLIFMVPEFFIPNAERGGSSD